MVRKVVGVAVLVLVLAGAGCGGSSEPEPLTKAEFAQKANAICKHRAAAYAAATAKSDVIRAVRAALPELETAVKRLSELQPPAALKSTYAEIMAIERHQVTIGKEALDGRILASEDGPHLHRHERQREELGMPACN